jgi:hypothetical protein
MPAVRTWTAFIEVVDDEVLLFALGYLHAAQHVLNLVAASASTAARLTSKVEGYYSVAHRFASARLGAPAAAAAALAAAAAAPEATTAYSHYAGDPLAGLRLIASATPAGEAVRLALALARGPQNVKEGSAGLTIVDGCHFLEKLFHMETGNSKRGYCSASTVAAANAALSVLLLDGSFGSNIMLASARAVREWEQELDMLVDSGHVKGFHKGYELVVAERRSAAEFLRDRLTKVSVSPCSAKREFDLALGDLDDTITGYREEGFRWAVP